MSARTRAVDRMWDWTGHITHIGTLTKDERSYNQNSLIEEMDELAKTLTAKELDAVTRAIEKAYYLGKGIEQ